jgi:activator of 2-hydroxyglutaryl-CoA dehydratase
VAAGGVALNKPVIRHIGKLIQQSITVDEYAHVYGAIGAAMSCREDGQEIGTELTIVR